MQYAFFCMQNKNGEVDPRFFVAIHTIIMRNAEIPSRGIRLYTRKNLFGHRQASNLHASITTVQAARFMYDNTRFSVYKIHSFPPPFPQRFTLCAEPETIR